MGIRRITLFDTHSRILNKEPSDHIIHKNMALFVSSCWFYFTQFVFFLVKFTAQHVFRIKMEEGSKEVIEDYSVSLEPVPEPNEMEERDFSGFGEEEEEEEEHSSFSFKFEYQIPKMSSITNKEGAAPVTEENYQTKTTNISNYRVASERDFSGFVEEPESMTFRVLESFVDGREEKIDSKPPSEKNFEGFIKKPEPATFQARGSFAGSSEEKIEGKFLADNDFGRLIKNPEAAPFQAHESFADISDEELEAKFLPERDFIGFGEQPEAKVFQVHESFANSSEKKMESEILSDEDYSPFVEDPEAISARVQAYFSDSCEEKLEAEPFVGSSEENLESGFLSSEEFKKLSVQSPVVMFLKDQKLEGKRSNEKEAISNFSGFDSDSDSISFSDGYSVKNLEVDSEDDGFLSERGFGDKENSIVSSTFEMELRENMEKIEEGQFSNQTSYRNIYDGFISDKGFNELERISEEKLHENYSPYTDKLSQLDEVWSENESLDPELELKELDTGKIGDAPSPQFSVQMEFMDDSSDDELSYSRKDSNKFDGSEFRHEDLNLEAESNSYSFDHLNASGGSNEGSEKRTEEENSDGTKMKDLDYDDLDELESLWEHQDLIEQLRMELKRVKAIGLPTIPEESESPKTIEDLKPWKLDEKFMKEDPLNEMHKFYKSYRERMRKLDILNYQKMYAIGFLQLKNPLESLGASKPLIPTIISHVSQNLRHRRKSITDPSEKFLKELQVDLETVYVGQTCLSWEFLHWQYEKARERRDSDPYRSHQYNQVAGEFQQFQVAVQRFVENESFQGPRLQNYVKNRCVLRNLLEVPVIREDRSKDRMEERKKGNYATTCETLEDIRDKMEEIEKAITSEKLEDIMEECIRVFWEFVKADRDETPTILKGLLRNQAELQEPSDFKLLSEIQASLHRKDKKLKDILKTGNCLVKKFKKPREDRSNQDLFFSQVDMKLISRVLKMSRITTDQLAWCHMKLSRITFADRKIHREQSFLLFPC